MPHTTPVRFAPFQMIPSTIPGKNAAAARENEAETKARIAAGFQAATNAARSATAKSNCRLEPSI
jgi:hypothetical protein